MLRFESADDFRITWLSTTHAPARLHDGGASIEKVASRQPQRRSNMFANTKAFSGFAVNDIEPARRFYGEIVGLETSE